MPAQLLIRCCIIWITKLIHWFQTALRSRWFKLHGCSNGQRITITTERECSILMFGDMLCLCDKICGLSAGRKNHGKINVPFNSHRSSNCRSRWVSISNDEVEDLVSFTGGITTQQRHISCPGEGQSYISWQVETGVLLSFNQLRVEGLELILNHRDLRLADGVVVADGLVWIALGNSN